MIKSPRTHALPFDQWPPLDKAAWNAAVSTGGPFKPSGWGASWSSGTHQSYRISYARWLGFLMQSNLLNPAMLPHLRVTEQTVRAYLGHLDGLADYTVLTALDALYSTIRAMAPACDWSWLHIASLNLRRLGPRSKPKHQRVIDSKRIFDAGLRLLEEAEDVGRLKRSAAMFRDGLALSLLASRPLRRANFAATTVGQHLVPEGEGWRLQFAASEMKNCRRLELPLPERLFEPMNRYLEQHRPVLLRGRLSDRLWISSWGNEMTGHAMNMKMIEITSRYLGRPLNLHLFRHCLATSIAVRDPQHVRMTTALLGHNGPRTAERYYNQAQGLEAARMFQQELMLTRERTAGNR